jgi:ribosomal-protein-alanine N-acetyltransferase
VPHKTRVRLRPMRLADVPRVVQIDRLSFSTPWPPRSYQYEITENDKSCMFVLCLADAPRDKRPDGLLRGLWQQLAGLPPDEQIVGYGGFWFVVDEAHVSTIAVHPDWRGRKLGELLLWAMMREAIHMQARQVTLEVRASNSPAQNLYRKYGFEVVGLRKAYYRDDREDAYLMTVHPLGAAYYKRLAVYGRELGHHVALIDEWPVERSVQG